MQPVFEPMSKELKEKLNQRGYKEWTQPYRPKISDPAEKECKFIIIKTISFLVLFSFHLYMEDTIVKKMLYLLFL